MRIVSAIRCVAQIQRRVRKSKLTKERFLFRFKMLYSLTLLFLTNFLKFCSPAPHGEIQQIPRQNGLQILMMIPAFDFNRSHVNYAVAIYKVLRKEHRVDFVVPYFVDADVKFLKENENLKDIIFYELKKPNKMVRQNEKEKKAQEKEQQEMGKKSEEAKMQTLKEKIETRKRQLPQIKVNHKDDNSPPKSLNSPARKKMFLEMEETSHFAPEANAQLNANVAQMETAENVKVEIMGEEFSGEIAQNEGAKVEKKADGEKVTLGEIMQLQSFGKRMDYFPDIWIDMLESGAFKGNKKYDLGMAEFSHTSQYAFAVFESLGIEHTISLRNYSPNAQQYADLGFSKAFINANMPVVEKTNIGDHEDWNLQSRQEQIGFDFFSALKGANDAIKKLDKKFAAFKLPHFQMPNAPSIRNYFKSSEYFLVNSQPDLEFDFGKVLLGNGGKEGENKNKNKVKMIGGIHLEEENYGEKEKTMAMKPLDPFPEKAEIIKGKIKKIKDSVGFEGIVLISFGSVVDTKRNKTKIFPQMNAIRGTIRRMPKYLFIWHLTAGDPLIEKLNGEKTNIYADDWLDMKAILADERTKVFISHCGKNTMFEAVYFGKATICVPIFGDQFYNAETLAKHQLAVVLDFYCIEINSGNGKNPQMFTLNYIKASGNTNLAELPDDFFLLNIAEQYKEFLEINREKDYIRNEKGETRMIPVEKYDYCFTEQNIFEALEEAINAIVHKETKSGRIDWKNMEKAKENLRSIKPHQILLETIREIEAKIKRRFR